MCFPTMECPAFLCSMSSWVITNSQPSPSPAAGALLPTNFLRSPGLLHQLLHSSQVCLGWKEVYLEPSFLLLPPYSSSARPEAWGPGCLDNFHIFGVLSFPPSLLFSCCSCLPPSPPCLTGKGCKKPPAPEVEQTGTLEGVSKPLTGLPEL